MTVKIETLASVCVALCALTGWSAGAKIPLWPEGKMPSVQENQPEKPYLIWHEPAKRTCDATVIAVSGGSYMGCGIGGFEVAPIRDYLLAKGVTVVTMKYRTPRPQGLPKHLTAWQDAQRTVRIVRSEAKARGLDPHKIGFTGCSAGGHLTLMTATSSETPAYAPIDEIDAIPCNIDFAIPVYPAYGLEPNADKSEVPGCDDLSVGLVPEFKFDPRTPPMCLVHGDSDVWSPMVSVRVYHKLRTMGIPAEIHVMALEGHCFQSNPRPGTPAATWKDRVWEWLVSMDIVTGHPEVWTAGWRRILPHKNLSEVADFERGVWRTVEWGNAVLTADRDSALWLKGAWGDFELDFEYKLDPGANSGVIIRCSDAVRWIPNSVEVQLLDDYSDRWKNDAPHLKGAGLYGHLAPKVAGTTRPAGEWNRMTVRAEGRRVKVIHNGVMTVDADLSAWTDAKTNPDGSKIPPWLSRPLADLPVRGRIGFQGLHGKARPYFRNIRIREIGN